MSGQRDGQTGPGGASHHYAPLDSSPPEGEDLELPFLASENYEWAAIPNLDVFFSRVYRYWQGRGLTSIFISGLLNLLALAFTIAFSAFLLLFVNWKALHAECIIQDTCDILAAALLTQPLRDRGVLVDLLILTYLAIFSLYWAWTAVHFVTELREMLETRHFYRNTLGVSERQVCTMIWAEVVHRMVLVQRTKRLCVTRDLNEHDIVGRIMRRDNYLIAMVNKGVLAPYLPLPRWLRRRRCAVLTKTLEWNLRWCILDHMFDDRTFRVRDDFLQDTAKLQRRFRRAAIANLLLSPFLLVFLLIYFFMHNAERFYSHPGSLGSRRWSALARWKLRELNELQHYVQHRLSASHAPACKYLAQFPSHTLGSAARFVAFVAGSFAALLLLVTMLDETLLERPLAGRHIVWWLAALGVVLTASRALVSEDPVAYDPEAAMGELAAVTHYMPRHWRGRAHTPEVQQELSSMFQFKVQLFLEEVASVLFTPFILYFVMPSSAAAIVDFVTRNTVEVAGVGHICSFAAFDVERHGNVKYGAPATGDKQERSKQGKVEKSLLTFLASYPTWEPPEAAQAMLTAINRHSTALGQGFAPGLASQGPFLHGGAVTLGGPAGSGVDVSGTGYGASGAMGGWGVGRDALAPLGATGPAAGYAGAASVASVGGGGAKPWPPLPPHIGAAGLRLHGIGPATDPRLGSAAFTQPPGLPFPQGVVGAASSQPHQGLSEQGMDQGVGTSGEPGPCPPSSHNPAPASGSASGLGLGLGLGSGSGSGSGRWGTAGAETPVGGAGMGLSSGSASSSVVRAHWASSSSSVMVGSSMAPCSASFRAGTGPGISGSAHAHHMAVNVWPEACAEASLPSLSHQPHGTTHPQLQQQHQQQQREQRDSHRQGLYDLDETLDLLDLEGLSHTGPSFAQLTSLEHAAVQEGQQQQQVAQQHLEDARQDPQQRRLEEQQQQQRRLEVQQQRQRQDGLEQEGEEEDEELDLLGSGVMEPHSSTQQEQQQGQLGQGQGQQGQGPALWLRRSASAAHSRPHVPPHGGLPGHTTGYVQPHWELRGGGCQGDAPTRDQRVAPHLFDGAAGAGGGGHGDHLQHQPYQPYAPSSSLPQHQQQQPPYLQGWQQQQQGQGGGQGQHQLPDASQLRSSIFGLGPPAGGYPGGSNHAFLAGGSWHPHSSHFQPVATGAWSGYGSCAASGHGAWGAPALTGGQAGAGGADALPSNETAELSRRLCRGHGLLQSLYCWSEQSVRDRQAQAAAARSIAHTRGGGSFGSGAGSGAALLARSGGSGGFGSTGSGGPLGGAGGGAGVGVGGGWGACAGAGPAGGSTWAARAIPAPSSAQTHFVPAAQASDQGSAPTARAGLGLRPGLGSGFGSGSGLGSGTGPSGLRTQQGAPVAGVGVGVSTATETTGAQDGRCEPSGARSPLPRSSSGGSSRRGGGGDGGSAGDARGQVTPVPPLSLRTTSGSLSRSASMRPAAPKAPTSIELREAAPSALHGAGHLLEDTSSTYVRRRL